MTSPNIHYLVLYVFPSFPFPKIHLLFRSVLHSIFGQLVAVILKLAAYEVSERLLDMDVQNATIIRRRIKEAHAGKGDV